MTPTRGSAFIEAISTKPLSHNAFPAVVWFANTLLASAAIIAATSVVAQTFPNRPIKMIVPLAAAGTGDTLARAVGEAMAKELGQAVVVENRPGAGGLLGKIGRAHV